MSWAQQLFGTPGATTKQATSSSAAEVSLAEGKTYRFIATEDCYLSFIAAGGTAADSSDMFVKANVPEVFSTRPGIDAVSVIRDSADGNLFVTEMLGGQIGG